MVYPIGNEGWKFHLGAQEFSPLSLEGVHRLERNEGRLAVNPDGWQLSEEGIAFLEELDDPNLSSEESMHRLHQQLLDALDAWDEENQIELIGRLNVQEVPIRTIDEAMTWARHCLDTLFQRIANTPRGRLWNTVRDLSQRILGLRGDPTDFFGNSRLFMEMLMTGNQKEERQDADFLTTYMHHVFMQRDELSLKDRALLSLQFGGGTHDADLCVYSTCCLIGVLETHNVNFFTWAAQWLDQQWVSREQRQALLSIEPPMFCGHNLLDADQRYLPWALAAMLVDMNILRLL